MKSLGDESVDKWIKPVFSGVLRLVPQNPNFIPHHLVTAFSKVKFKDCKEL